MARSPITHGQLVQRADRWLRNTRKCALVMVEVQTWATNEFPDAIGWTHDGYSILVECKTSRGDFHADKRKTCKRAVRIGTRSETMGRERWYMTPPGLLTAADLPPGYGLLELHGRTLRKVVRASVEERPGRHEAEAPLLIAASRREAWGRGWKGRCVSLTCAASEPEPAPEPVDDRQTQMFAGGGDAE